MREGREGEVTHTYVRIPMVQGFIQDFRFGGNYLCISKRRNFFLRFGLTIDFSFSISWGGGGGGVSQVSHLLYETP